MKGVTKGRIVHYVLTEADAAAITSRRTGAGHGENWPEGAMAHTGNPAVVGEHVPAMIVEVFMAKGCVNLQCFLDGNDSFWATSRMFDEKEKTPGTWHWIDGA